MKYANFKEHKITRTCTVQFDKPRKYAKYLKRDFHCRCCYCNMHEDLVAVPYHVEHFIPEKIFKNKKDYLKTDYENLMWSCPKCNLSKGDKYKGDIESNSKIVNELFYNPVYTDYNTIFYRNELGGIDSDDPKGREMIKMLKLYRPLHNLGWLLERLEKMCDQLEIAINKEKDPERKRLLELAAGKLAREYVKKVKVFRAAYKGNKVFVQNRDAELDGE